MVLKARGTAHSNQMREFSITSHGLELETSTWAPPGSSPARPVPPQEAAERIAEAEKRHEFERKQRSLARKRALVEARIASLRAELAAEEKEMAKAGREEQAQGENRRRATREDGPHAEGG